MNPILGCIADDVTGATDIASALATEGLRVVQLFGEPAGPLNIEVDAVVIALKIRTEPVKWAMQQAVNACAWLQNQGSTHYYFKYCSTFDSTDGGNIVPISEALMGFLDNDFTVVCPALPINQRTVYQGYLFVDDRLLAESSMRDHPITPMRESNLRAVINKQSIQHLTAGLVPYQIVQEGSKHIRNHLKKLHDNGHHFAVIDAISDDNLYEIAKSCEHMRLLTGASALAQSVARLWRQSGVLIPKTKSSVLPSIDGPVVVLAGSCSLATREQVHMLSLHYPLISLNSETIAIDKAIVANTSRATYQKLQQYPVVIISSAQSPQQVVQVQQAFGKDQISKKVENFFANVAKQLLTLGIRKFIVAGGETSGAVANALAVKQIRIGPAIAPGVPWTVTTSSPETLLAFKSGNFGDKNFFITAAEMVL